MRKQVDGVRLMPWLMMMFAVVACSFVSDSEPRGAAVGQSNAERRQVVLDSAQQVGSSSGVVAFEKRQRFKLRDQIKTARALIKAKKRSSKPVSKKAKIAGVVAAIGLLAVGTALMLGGAQIGVAAILLLLSPIAFIISFVFGFQGLAEIRNSEGEIGGLGWALLGMIPLVLLGSILLINNVFS